MIDIPKSALVRKATKHSHSVTVELFFDAPVVPGASRIAAALNFRGMHSVEYDLITESGFELAPIFGGWVVTVREAYVEQFVEALDATLVLHYARNAT